MLSALQKSLEGCWLQFAPLPVRHTHPPHVSPALGVLRGSLQAKPWRLRRGSKGPPNSDIPERLTSSEGEFAVPRAPSDWMLEGAEGNPCLSC